METTNTDFLGDLRAQTADFHKRVEALPISELMVSDKIRISDYTVYLKHMHIITAGAETNIFPIVGKTIPDIENRRKLKLIESDLNHIGFQPDTQATLFNGNHSVPFALGIMYVVEGSTLGGRFLMNSVNSVLGDAVTTNYFAGYGQHTGSSWKKFLEFLTTYADSEGCADEIISGAVYGFKAIHQELSSVD